MKILHKFLILILCIGISFSIIPTKAFWEDHLITPGANEVSLGVSNKHWAYGIKHYYAENIKSGDHITGYYNWYYDTYIEDRANGKKYIVNNPFTRAGVYENFTVPKAQISSIYTTYTKIAVKVIDDEFHPENSYYQYDVISHNGKLYYFKKNYQVIYNLNFIEVNSRFIREFLVELNDTAFSKHVRYFNKNGHDYRINFLAYKLYKPYSVVYHVPDFKDFSNEPKFYIADYDYTGLSASKLNVRMVSNGALDSRFWKEIKEYNEFTNYNAGDYVYYKPSIWKPRTLTKIVKIKNNTNGYGINNSNSEIIDPIVD